MSSFTIILWQKMLNVAIFTGSQKKIGNDTLLCSTRQIIHNKAAKPGVEVWFRVAFRRLKTTSLADQNI